MKNKIFIITDYKGQFGSKWDSDPYRSGFQLSLLVDMFEDSGYKTCIINFSEAANGNQIKKNDYVIYTSTEDTNYQYKDFIDDVIYYLNEKGVKLIPGYEFLKATNNKVSMELLRKLIFPNSENLESNVYGALEEYEEKSPRKSLVFKKPKGAMSRGVYLSKNSSDRNKIISNVSRSKNYKQEIKDYFRAYKHDRYILESRYRSKFVVQSFVKELACDYKILIFGSKYFIFSRPVRENDFRASGSGFEKYLFGSKCSVPDGIFKYSESIFNNANVPNLSLDIAFDGKKFYLLEFQALNFGTVGFTKSDVYFENQNGNWQSCMKNMSIESIYVDSIVSFIDKVK